MARTIFWPARKLFQLANTLFWLARKLFSLDRIRQHIILVGMDAILVAPDTILPGRQNNKALDKTH